MERLWSPWRHEYITRSTAENLSEPRCIFCAAAAVPENDETNLVVYRGALNFVILNRYPYISGHLMIAPYAHLDDLDAAPKTTCDEMMDLAKRSQSALRDTYRPQGFNLGMNLGHVAGAGIADHIHLHLLPRWKGDTNFMSTVAETRVLPEDLGTTYKKLLGKI